LNINEVLFSEELRARILSLEYKNLTAEKIRQIYFEETGKELDINIKIYRSKDYEQVLNIGKYGFDGTIIHFFDETTKTNQVYSIARGSEMSEEIDWRPQDWLYNIMGIFVGGSKVQYADAEIFENYILKMIRKETVQFGINLTKIGMGHSLGGNTKQIQQLKNNDCYKVYVYNDAPPTVYQLVKIDPEFFLKLQTKFGIVDPNEVYYLNPNELKEFAEEYYKDAAKNIYHVTAEEDFLYNVTLSVRGFIHVGEYKFVNTVPGFGGFYSVLKNIPDELVQEIQVFLAEFAPIYNKHGFDGVVKEMLGIDLKFVEELMEEEIFKIPLRYPEIEDNLSRLYQKLPELLKFMSHIRENLDIILATLEHAGYIDAMQKKIIKEEFNNLILEIEDFSSFMEKHKDFDLIHLISILSRYKRVKKHWEKLEEPLSGLLEKINLSVDSHGLYTMINALNFRTPKEYIGGDLFWTHQVAGEQPIKLNISASYRIYNEGMAVFDSLEENLKKLRVEYEEAYLHDFENRKATLLKTIEFFEANPLRLSIPFIQDREYVFRVDISEQIMPLPEYFHSIFDEMFFYYEYEISKGREKILQIKNAIEKMFEMDRENAQKIQNYFAPYK